MTDFEVINNNPFDCTGGVSEFILEDRLGSSDSRSGELPVTTPFKCPKLQHRGFADDGNDKDYISTKQCVVIEEEFKEA